MKLSRFWFKFDLALKDPQPAGVLIGCGVTAFNQGDAIGILKDRVFVSYPFPEIKALVIDVDISKLNEGHVVPNMGDPSRRGVWFLLGYS